MTAVKKTKPQQDAAANEAVNEAEAALAAYIEAHADGARSVPQAALVGKVLAAWSLARRIDALEDELAPMKKELAAALEGASLVVPKVCRVSVTRSSSVGLGDVEKMQQLLGERFGDLVEASVSYKPSDKLVQMSVDGDDPWAPAYRALLKVRNSVAVRLLAER